MTMTCRLVLDTGQSAGRGCENRCKALTILIRALKAVTCIDVLRHALRGIFGHESLHQFSLYVRSPGAADQCHSVLVQLSAHLVHVLNEDGELPDTLLHQAEYFACRGLVSRIVLQRDVRPCRTTGRP
jgi:hypothetical protein